MATAFCPVCAFPLDSIVEMTQHVGTFHFNGEANGPEEISRRLGNLGYNLPPSYFEDRNPTVR